MFTEILLSILLSAYSIVHKTAEIPAEERARIASIADDMWQATGTAERLPFCGPARREASCLALAAVAIHESGLWSRVQDCSICRPGSKWCGGGKSITIYQLEGPVAWGGYSRRDLCASNRAATARAVAVLAHFRRSAEPVAMFDGYARGGPAKRPCRAARAMANMLWTFAKKAGVRVAYLGKAGCMHAVMAPKVQ